MQDALQLLHVAVGVLRCRWVGSLKHGRTDVVGWVHLRSAAAVGISCNEACAVIRLWHGSVSGHHPLAALPP